VGTVARQRPAAERLQQRTAFVSLIRRVAFLKAGAGWVPSWTWPEPEEARRAAVPRVISTRV